MRIRAGSSAQVAEEAQLCSQGLARIWMQPLKVRIEPALQSDEHRCLRFMAAQTEAATRQGPPEQKYFQNRFRSVVCLSLFFHKLLASFARSGCAHFLFSTMPLQRRSFQQNEDIRHRQRCTCPPSPKATLLGQHNEDFVMQLCHVHLLWAMTACSGISGGESSFRGAIAGSAAYSGSSSQSPPLELERMVRCVIAQAFCSQKILSGNYPKIREITLSYGAKLRQITLSYAKFR